MGTLAAGKSTGEIQRFAKGDWSAFIETNDYSYSTATTYGDWAKVTAYRSGALVWDGADVVTRHKRPGCRAPHHRQLFLQVRRRVPHRPAISPRRN